MLPEKWKAIPGYEGWYEVSDCGRVRSLERTTRHGRKRKQHVLRAGLSTNHYPKVDLSRDAEHCTRMVHQLVLEAFVGPADEGMQSCHRNGVRQDNRLCNLYYGTARDNALDRNRHGNGRAIGPGEQHPRAILTEEDVLAIRAWPRYGRGLYEKFSFVSRATVDHARSGRNWKHLL